MMTEEWEELRRHSSNLFMANIVKIVYQEFTSVRYCPTHRTATFYNIGYDADGQKWQWFSTSITLNDGVVLDGGCTHFIKLEE